MAADPITALRSMRAAAPESLLRNVLEATGHIDHYELIDGPLGPLYVAFTDRGISAVVPQDQVEDFRSRYESDSGRMIAPGTLPARWRASLDRVLRTGKLGGLPVDLEHLSEFQQAVLRTTAAIPPGQLRTYGWIAREIGKPGAVRAVGSALNRNPVPVIIPCHRVGRSDGSIGNYAYGPEMKHALLQHEGLDVEAVEEMASRGVALTGSDTTNIYCFPTCSHARRTTDKHRVEFRSAAGAAAAGYRPCKVCRPLAA